MEEVHGAIWDMDGVLVNTGEFHWQSWSTVLSERGVPFTREQFRNTFGMNNVGILEIVLGERAEPDLIAEISDQKERVFRRIVKGHAHPLPGVIEWLDSFRSWGYRQAIASSAPPANIDVLVGELGIRVYFAAIVSGADLPGKPDPAVFLKAAQILNVPPGRCVVVEDAIAGVAAAKRAGMKCIAVTTTNPAQELQDADIVVEQLDALATDEFKQLMA